LTISIPQTFSSEIKYVLKVLLKENLNNHNYHIQESSANNVVFKSTTGSLTIQNDFFVGSYESLHIAAHLPINTVKVKVDDKEVVVLYGNDKFSSEGNDYYLGADIISSTYFMLTQWESTITPCDSLGRYSYTHSSIKRLDLYHRPIVNEYIALLQYLLNKLGVNTATSIYHPIFTCDVDNITKYHTFNNLLGGLRHMRSLSVIKEYFTSKKNKRDDVYFTFPYMLSILDNKNIDALFYFMTEAEDTAYDIIDYNLSDNIISNLASSIRERNYNIGLHPSINSWKNGQTIARQKKQLESSFGIEVKDCRQHYLRYDVNTTWALYDELNIKSDSSMQFSEGKGFAAGMCTPYTLYDLSTRSATDVVEIPLIYMKKKESIKSVESSFKEYKAVIDQAKKHNGKFMILFHNTDLETVMEKKLFEEAVNYL
jgi:hypothetical protein